MTSKRVAAAVGLALAVTAGACSDAKEKPTGVLGKSVSRDSTTTSSPPTSVLPEAIATTTSSTTSTRPVRSVTSTSTVAVATVRGRAWPTNDLSNQSNRGELTLNRDGKLVAKTQTDADGMYVFRGLAPGRYELTSTVTHATWGPCGTTTTSTSTTMSATTTTEKPRECRASSRSEDMREFDLSPGEDRVENFH